MIAKEEILDAILVTCCAKTLPQRYALVLIVSLPDTTQPRPAEEWRGGWRSHRGASVRGPHAAEHGVSSAGDAQPPLSDARGREHRAADTGGPRAVPAGAVEARRAVQGSAGPAESESPTLAGTAGADR